MTLVNCTWEYVFTWRSLWNLDKKSTSLSWFRSKISRIGFGLLGLATNTWKKQWHHIIISCWFLCKVTKLTIKVIIYKSHIKKVWNNIDNSLCSRVNTDSPHHLLCWIFLLLNFYDKETGKKEEITCNIDYFRALN